MSKRIVVDPVTRIEGHLRVEADIENGKIVDAYSSGTMVRLLEEILRGRDPRDAWAFVGRVCGRGGGSARHLCNGATWPG
jgi:hydrogenase large subunit